MILDRPAIALGAPAVPCIDEGASERLAESQLGEAEAARKPLRKGVRGRTLTNWDRLGVTVQGDPRRRA